MRPRSLSPMLSDSAPKPARVVRVGNVVFGQGEPLVLVAGPCQIEHRDHLLRIAEHVVAEAQRAGIGIVFKSSFDKANRSSLRGKRGVGIDEGLKLLAEVRQHFGCPVLTDIHLPDQAEPVAQAVDVIQIPAFLSRQTDLLLAAGRTGAAINVKKAQFAAPADMVAVVEKIASTGNDRIILCDRGTSFGYNMLVSDMRGLSIMAESGFPVMFDATHSVQEPGSRGQSSGGERRFAPLLARSAVAAGVAALFVETHDDPDHAPSDGAVMLPLQWLRPMLADVVAIDAVAKRRGSGYGA